MSSEWLAEQRRGAIFDSSFQRLHLNEWVEPEDRLASMAAIRACVGHEVTCRPQRGVTYVMGLDLGFVHDPTAAAICHAETFKVADGAGVERRIVVDEVYVWPGTREKPVLQSDVREWIEDRARLYWLDRVVFDPHQAIGLAQELRRRGVVLMNI